MASIVPQTEQEGTHNPLFDDITLPTVICCLCGVTISPNPSNMCLSCLKAQVNIIESIPSQNQLQWCKFCGRYLQPPNNWLSAELESNELLALCLKRIKGYGGRDQPR